MGSVYDASYACGFQNNTSYWYLSVVTSGTTKRLWFAVARTSQRCSSITV